MSITSEINEDINCLKYVLTHGGVGGSVIRLARMIRMMYVVMILSIIFLIYRYVL